MVGWVFGGAVVTWCGILGGFGSLVLPVLFVGGTTQRERERERELNKLIKIGSSFNILLGWFSKCLWELAIFPS